MNDWAPTFYEYQVLEVKDSLFRGKQSSDALQNIINEQAQYGWRFRQAMADEINGRLGIGSTAGMLLTFERVRPPA